LHVTAGSGQVAAINSTAFPVDVRARFTVAFAARVSPASVGSGYFDLVFLGPEQEVARTTVKLAAASIALGRRTTSRLGRFAAPSGRCPPARISSRPGFVVAAACSPRTRRSDSRARDLESPRGAFEQPLATDCGDDM
jgi:hypothetical protein